jgi:hypothetical protein
MPDEWNIVTFYTIDRLGSYIQGRIFFNRDPNVIRKIICNYFSSFNEKYPGIDIDIDEIDKDLEQENKMEISRGEKYFQGIKITFEELFQDECEYGTKYTMTIANDEDFLDFIKYCSEINFEYFCKEISKDFLENQIE